MEYFISQPRTVSQGFLTWPQGVNVISRYRYKMTQHVLTEDFPFLAEMALMIRIVYLIICNI